MTLSTTALAQYDTPKLAAALERAEARIRELEQENSTLRTEIRWIDRLLAVPASIMSPSHKVTLRAAVKAYQQGAPDENCLVQIESWKLCKTVGQSRQTFLNNLTYCVEKLGILTKKRERLVESATNDYTTNLYIGVTPRLSHPHQYRVEAPRNHGGERQLCPHCHSDRLQRKVIMTCMNCGSVLDEKICLVNQESHLDDAPESQVDQAENMQLQDDREPLPDTDVNLTSSKTTVLERQVDDSALPQQEPATPPLGEPMNDVVIPDTQRQEVSPLGSSDLKSEYLSHSEQYQPQPGLSTTDTLSQADLLAHAAKLLVEIAGPEPVHIEMSDRGPKKYYDVRRVITQQDTRAHLKGWKTKGAYLRCPDGMTRAFCYDADTLQDWEHLLDAARCLAEAGYRPIVEDSPASGRGGHLWIIYTRLVSASAAHQHLLQVAPMLQHIKECWPSPGPNKVRLPGGKYIKPGFAAWCRLHDAHGARIAGDGQSAARVLLLYQTPAELVPDSPAPEAVPQRASSDADQPMSRDGAQPAQGGLAHNGTPFHDEMQPGVDQHWHHKYRQDRPFHFTPAQLAAWYNERYDVTDIIEFDKDGRANASVIGRPERTPSLASTKDRKRFTDFGASARRADGKPDGGDALELRVRVNATQYGVSKAQTLRQVAHEFLGEAEATLQHAASKGEQPPAWLQTFMSPAGWEHYHQLREETGYPDQATPAIPGPAAPTGGAADFSYSDHDTPASQTHLGQEQQQGQRQLQHSVQAVPSSDLMQALAMLEAIKNYGQTHEWAALVMDEEELIPAGRSSWLQFVWLSHNKEQQRRVYEFIAGGSAREEATTLRLDAARPSVLEDNRTINFVNGWSK